MKNEVGMQDAGYKPLIRKSLAVMHNNDRG
jgi:hypothetical protein